MVTIGPMWYLILTFLFFYVFEEYIKGVLRCLTVLCSSRPMTVQKSRDVLFSVNFSRQSFWRSVYLLWINYLRATNPSPHHLIQCYHAHYSAGIFYYFLWWMGWQEPGKHYSRNVIYMRIFFTPSPQPLFLKK